MPSSRHPAAVHQTAAFEWVRLPPPPYKTKPLPNGSGFILEQDTGVEPAFTAWEAVVLPIYESCVLHASSVDWGNYSRPQSKIQPQFVDEVK